MGERPNKNRIPLKRGPRGMPLLKYALLIGGGTVGAYGISQIPVRDISRYVAPPLSGNNSEPPKGGGDAESQSEVGEDAGDPMLFVVALLAVAVSAFIYSRSQNAHVER